MKYRIKIFSIILIVLTVVTKIAVAQKDSTFKNEIPLHSFRIKTELVEFTGLNPNLFVEYKINKRLAFSFGLIYHFNAIIWTAPYLVNDEPERESWLTLKGQGIDMGMKYYNKPKQYYSIRLNADIYTFVPFLDHSYLFTTPIKHDIRRKDYQLRFLKGKEVYKNKSFFFEYFYGFGILAEYRQFKRRHLINNNGYVVASEPDPNTLWYAATFHFGFNIGFQLKGKRLTTN
jgi:hypothetical protein